MSDTSRALFERHQRTRGFANSNVFSFDELTNKYNNNGMQSEWAIWQAATMTLGGQVDLLQRALRSSRTVIRKIKRTTNQFDEARAYCIAADKKITRALKAAQS